MNYDIAPYNKTKTYRHTNFEIAKINSSRSSKDHCKILKLTHGFPIPLNKQSEVEFKRFSD